MFSKANQMQKVLKRKVTSAHCATFGKWAGVTYAEQPNLASREALGKPSASCHKKKKKKKLLFKVDDNSGYTEQQLLISLTRVCHWPSVLIKTPIKWQQNPGSLVNTAP